MINKSLLLISLEQGAHRYLAFLILVISSILIIFNLLFLRSSIYFEFAITLLCISTVYLVFEKKLTENSTIIVPKMQLINIKVINISFFVFIIISNCLFYFNLYRPQIYFIAIVLCCVLIAFDILYTKSYIYSIWVLFKIFIIAFILRAHLLYEYPGFYGVDPWEHALWIRLLQEYGHVSLVSGLNLGYPPLFHIEVLISFLFTGLDLKNSFFFSIGFVYCIVIFFIFLFVPGYRIKNLLFPR